MRGPLGRVRLFPGRRALARTSRLICAIALATVLSSAVAVGGVAGAAPSGTLGEVAAKKKGKKKKGKKKGKKGKKKGKKGKGKKPAKPAKAATSFKNLNFETPDPGDYVAITGTVESPKGICRTLRKVQAVQVSNGAVLDSYETGDFNKSFSLLVTPRPGAGTQLRVVAPETKSCKRGTSGIFTVPAQS